MESFVTIVNGFCTLTIAATLSILDICGNLRAWFQIKHFLQYLFIIYPCIFFIFFFVSFHLRNQYKKAALIGTDTFSDLLQNACNFIKIALRHGCSVKNFTTFSVHIVSKSFERVLLTKWWEINPTLSQNLKTLSPNFSYVILQYPLQKQIINKYD